MESYPAMQRREVLIHATLRTNLKKQNDSDRKKPDTKGHMLYDFIYMSYPEWVNTQKQTADWGLPVTEGGGGGAEECEVSLWGEGNTLELERGGSCPAS